MNIINRGYYLRVALIFCAHTACGYYSRVATIWCAATIRIITVYIHTVCSTRLPSNRSRHRNAISKWISNSGQGLTSRYAEINLYTVRCTMANRLQELRGRCQWTPGCPMETQRSRKEKERTPGTGPPPNAVPHTSNHGCAIPNMLNISSTGAEKTHCVKSARVIWQMLLTIHACVLL